MKIQTPAAAAVSQAPAVPAPLTPAPLLLPGLRTCCSPGSAGPGPSQVSAPTRCPCRACMGHALSVTSAPCRPCDSEIRGGHFPRGLQGMTATSVLRVCSAWHPESHVLSPGGLCSLTSPLGPGAQPTPSLPAPIPEAGLDRQHISAVSTRWPSLPFLLVTGPPPPPSFGQRGASGTDAINPCPRASDRGFWFVRPNGELGEQCQDASCNRFGGAALLPLRVA